MDSVAAGARVFAIAIVLASSITGFLSGAHAEGPAVSALNGKISGEGGVTGVDGHASGIAMTKGSITAPLGQAFGFQLDGLAGTAFNAPFGGGTGHLFWRDPAIGLFGPVVSVAAGSGERSGWYGAEGEVYVRRLTLGMWAGYHDVDLSGVGRASSGYYGGGITVYPTLDLALTVGATSAFNRVVGNSTIEFQPDLFARRNMAFYVDGEVADRSAYTVTAGIRFYFGADKPLIRRHREDDPMTAGRPTPLTDLLEPPLRVLVDVGYDRYPARPPYP
jgi:hypothetical protein